MSEKPRINFESLEPEFFSNENTWAEFMEALADVIEEQIRAPIGEIEDIRHIIETTDPEIIARTIKQIGFDIPADLIRHNANKLAKSVYMLALFHEKSGTEDFIKGVRFVLGREIELSHTYTQDYENFYRAPGGPLLIDGGDWYKTTHVDIGMELLPSDANMVLPVGKTLADRLLDAYFEFAPINHVVREFYFMVNMRASMGVAGKILMDKRDFITIGLGGEVLRSIRAMLPDDVDSGSTLPVYTDLLYYGQGCFDLVNPRYGYAAGGYSDGRTVETVLPHVLPNTHNTTLVLSASGEYGYFAYPVELGKARFVDPVTGVSGGWNGATWPADGSFGQTTGPRIIKSTVANVTQELYLYRTDLPIRGAVTFNVEFDNPGLRNSCDFNFELPTPAPEPELIVPDDEDQEPVPCVENLTPVFGVFNSGLSTDAHLDFLSGETGTNNNQRFTLDVPADKYGYFAYPIDLGYAEFVDSATGLEGGWGGATWNGQEVGATLDPIVVVRNICGQAIEWLVYRTEVAGIGNRSFDVSFGHPGTQVPVEGEEDPVAPCISGYPTFVVGMVDLNPRIALELDGYVLPDTDNTLIAGNLEEYEYGWLAHPVELGVATITERASGGTDLWDGAGWPNDGSTGDTTGPIVIQRSISGKLYDWYLYRTNSHNMGEVAFDVTFPNAGLCVDTVIAFPPTEEQTPVVESPIKDLPCHLNGLPRFASLDTFNGKTTEALAQVFSSTEEQAFTVDIKQGEYGYFAYPTALGRATFVEVNSNLVGGWGGATWDESGSIGSSFGPALIEHIENGVAAKWYIYRTDWPSLGNLTFRVAFENSGLPLGHEVDNCDTGTAPVFGNDISDAIFEPASMPATSLVAKVTDAPVSMRMFSAIQALSSKAVAECVVNGYPRFGSAKDVVDSNQVKALTERSDVTDNHSFHIEVEDGQYGWYAYPAALGLARFVDSMTGIAGGWDGATWPQGSIELSTGPVLVRVNVGGVETPWFVYRTDLPSIGEGSFRVYFENIGLSLDDSIPYDTAGVPAPISTWSRHATTNTRPVFGVSDTFVVNNADINAKLTGSILDMGRPSFTLNVPAGHHAYLAYPAYLGHAKITSTRGEVGWEGDSTPHPMYIYRRVDGEMQVWYLYRTRLPGVGSHTFNVVFGSAGLPDTTGRRAVRITPPVMTTDRPDIVTFNSRGAAQFAQVYRDTKVHITVSFGGRSDTRAVIVKGHGPALESILLEAPTTVDGGSNFNVTVRGRFTDGVERTIDDASINVLSPYVLRKTGYKLRTGNPPEDTVLYLEAAFITRDNNRLKSVRPVVLKSIDQDVTVSDLFIIGPPQMVEKGEQVFRAHVFFSDGTQKDVLALWESSSPGLHVDQSGNARAGIPDADFQATLKATFQFKGIKHVATKDVEIKRDYITPKSLTIQGPTRVVELSNTVFVGHMHWSNGTVTQVMPEWSTNRFSIAEDGVFTSGSVGSAVSVELVARAQGMRASKVVSVYPTPVNIEHINIVGQENVRENIMASYRAFAHYTDGRSIEVYPQWSIVESDPHVSMSAEGDLLFTDGPAGIVEVRAIFDNGVKRFTQTKPIVLIPNVNLITGLVIHGDSEILENRRGTLVATALYEDGTAEVVEPFWSVRSPDPLNAPEAMADIVSPGIIQGRSVDEDTVVIVEARFFREVAEYPIVIMHHDRPGPSVPLSARIAGPAVLPVSRIGSYTLWIEFDNGCSQEIAVSNDWSINVENDVAVLDPNGFLRSTNNKTTPVTITAEWACEGHAVTRTMDVLLLAEDSPLQALYIRGAEIMEPNSFSSYETELYYVGDEVLEGQGTKPNLDNIKWSVVTQIPNVTISEEGSLYAGPVPNGTEIVIKAVYTEGLHTVETTKMVVVRSEEPTVPDTVSYLPMYGLAPGGTDSFQAVKTYLDRELPGQQTGQTFKVEAVGNNYVYFAHPASLGIATFTETTLGLAGGMEGATWPADGSIGTTYGPLTITRTVNGKSENWYLYRSDFPGIGEVEFRVDYP